MFCSLFPISEFFEGKNLKNISSLYEYKRPKTSSNEGLSKTKFGSKCGQIGIPISVKNCRNDSDEAATEYPKRRENKKMCFNGVKISMLFS